MIKNMSIKNYKGFENLKINGLSNINLIGGENNIGKTSLLESVFTFYNKRNPQTIIKQLLYKGIIIELHDNQEHKVWSSLFHNYNIKKTLQFQFEYIDNIKHNVEIKIKKNVSKNFLHIKDLLADKIKPVTFISSLLKNTVKLSEINREDYKDEIINALKIIDNRIKSVILLAESEQNYGFYFDVGIGKKVMAYYFGKGAVKLLKYTLAIITTKNGIVLIDEIENGIHYSKQKDVWRFLFTLAKKYSVQIFATTHSKEMTEAFVELSIKEKLIESFMYIELFRNYKTKEIYANTIDIDTLAYKIINRKNFRGE